MRKRKTFFLALFLAFTLILLFPILVETVLYHNMKKIIQMEANRSNTAMLEQISQVIDGRLLEVQKLAIQISFHPKVQLMLNRKLALGTPPPYDYKELMELLSSYTAPYEFIEDFYVYFRDQDTVVTPYVKSKIDVFYSSYYAYDSMSMERWRNRLITGGQEAAFLPAMSVKEKPKSVSKKMITYIRPLPFGELGDSRGAFVVLLKEASITRLFTSMEGAHHANIFIVDKSGQLLSYTSQDLMESDVKQHIEQLVTKEDKAYSLTVNGEEMLVNSIQSEESGWKYISMIPNKVVFEKVNNVQVWALYLLIFCLVLGIASAYIFAKLFYRPINKLVRSIMIKRDLQVNWEKGDFRLIEDTLDHSWKSTNQLKELLDKQSPTIRSNFLSRLIRGLVDEQASHSDSLEFMGIRFPSNHFAIILLEVDEIGKLSSIDSERQWAMARFIAGNISQELFAPAYSVYLVEMDKNLLALLISLEVDMRDSADQDFRMTCMDIKSYIGEKFQISISLGISDIHEGVREIFKCYSEAVAALEYRIVTGKSAVTHYKEINQADQRYYYPLEMEMMLTNAIKSGDFTSANRLISEVFETNFTSRELSLEMGRCLYFNMMSTLLRIWNDTSERYEGLFGDGFHPIQLLSECRTLGEMQEQIRVIYRTICEAVLSTQKAPGAMLVEQIAIYIERHYTENTLSLNSISQEFNLTPQYLSAVFKKHHGQNLADYMARIRIEKAKPLLEEGRMTLNEIANHVGYANDAGFIRVFKKYVGVTPGKYRGNFGRKA